MVYIINVLISCVYIYMLKKEKRMKFFFFFPVIIIWTLILGLQYGVGTDYFSYIAIFQEEGILDSYFSRGEFIFFYFVKILKFFFDSPQSFFIFVGLFDSCLFYVYLKKMIKYRLIKMKYTYMYIFLFLCFSTIFYNQMNLIRQYINIYLLGLLCFYMYYNEYFNYFITWCIGLNIHRSFFIMVLLFNFKKFIKWIDFKKLKVLLIIGFIFSLLPLEEILKKIIILIPRYGHYANAYFFVALPLKKKITKLIYFPFYIFSLKLLKREYGIKSFMLKVGILSYILKIVTLQVEVVSRVGEYFSLVAIYPMYLLIENWMRKKMYLKIVIFCGSIFLIFVLKVLIFPTGEYLYTSCLSKI